MSFNFQSFCLCLMVIMFSRNQAALLSIQLYVMCHVSAEILAVEHILVSRGDSVTFTCNISQTNLTQLSWTKDRYLYTYSVRLSQTFSNFTSRHRLTIDINLHSKLNISNIQHDDAGLYRCNFTAEENIKTIEWNLTVSEPGGISPLWYSIYTLTAVIGFLLCVVVPAVCLYRILRTRTTEQDQFQLQSDGEVASSQPQSDTSSRTHSRSQYMERLNSIYGF